MSKIVTWRKEIQESIFSRLPLHLQCESGHRAEIGAGCFLIQWQDLYTVLRISYHLIDPDKPADCSQECRCRWDWQQGSLESFQAISTPGCRSACQRGRRWSSSGIWGWCWLLPSQPLSCCFGTNLLSSLCSLPTPLWNPLGSPCMDGGLVSILRWERENMLEVPGYDFQMLFWINLDLSPQQLHILHRKPLNLASSLPLPCQKLSSVCPCLSPQCRSPKLWSSQTWIFWGSLHINLQKWLQLPVFMKLYSLRFRVKTEISINRFCCPQNCSSESEIQQF